jgi:antitoxin component of RelBE/YafQ-DinJ toxin-antitoxin module
MAKNTLLGVWVEPDLEEQITIYAKQRGLTTSELGRLLFTGVLLEKR